MHGIHACAEQSLFSCRLLLLTAALSLPVMCLPCVEDALSTRTSLLSKYWVRLSVEGWLPAVMGRAASLPSCAANNINVLKATRQPTPPRTQTVWAGCRTKLLRAVSQAFAPPRPDARRNHPLLVQSCD